MCDTNENKVAAPVFVAKCTRCKVPHISQKFGFKSNGARYKRCINCRSSISKYRSNRRDMKILTTTGKNTLDAMLNYQKVNKVTGQCFTNTMIYWDIINALCPSVSCNMFAGILYYKDTENDDYYFIHHCWCEVNGKTIDPSHEYSNVKFDKMYYKTIAEVFKDYPAITDDIKKKLVDRVSHAAVGLQMYSKDRERMPPNFLKYYREVRNHLFDKMILRKTA